MSKIATEIASAQPEDSESAQNGLIQGKQAWAFLDLCSDGIAVVEAESWQISHGNRQLRQWLGEGAGTAGSSALELVPTTQQEELLGALEAVRRGAVESASLETEFSNGSEPMRACLRVGRGQFDQRLCLVLVVQQKSQSTAPATHLPSSRRDPLTGLLDRNFIFAQLQMLLERSRREGTRFAVLFVDLDNFKEINDTHGHVVGDEILREIAHRLSACLRAGDTIARYGGDEFVVLVQGVQNDRDCRPIVERIHAALQRPLPHAVTRASVSVGVEVVDGSQATAEEVLHAADRAMYASKEQR